MNRIGSSRQGIVIAIAAAACCAVSATSIAQEALLEAFFSDLPDDPQELADSIIDDVAAIRGLQFRREISVNNQTKSEFEEYLASEMDRALPPDRARVFGRVIKKLGLYDGPVIEDTVSLITLLATSQAAAYYDPESSAFYVLLEDASKAMLAPIYAHELYHGLQDQYWDLDEFVLSGIRNGLNDDEMLARQAVVEGEATYVMTLWMLRKVTGTVPTGFMLDLAVQTQAQLDSNALREMTTSGLIPGSLSDDLQASISAMDQIPQFMMETMLGVYLKGMGFVHQVVRTGWDEADRLYSDPPRSTEQILHPEKWLERDDPVQIDLAGIELAPQLEDWTMLDSNVIGEFQWRIIFNEFDMTTQSTDAAAGWDGDLFSVYERGDELLLLLFTTWDSASEADEFAVAYRELLGRKYQGEESVTAVQVRGQDVLIVEGGDPDETAGFLELLGNAGKI